MIDAWGRSWKKVMYTERRDDSIKMKLKRVVACLDRQPLHTQINIGVGVRAPKL